MDEIINDFVTETEELIELIENDLVSLENVPGDLELINGIFRNIHTIKGAAGFLGYKKMVDIVHCAENVLNKCRLGELEVTAHLNNVLLTAVDMLKVLLNSVRAREEPTVDIGPITDELLECLEPRKEEEVAEEPESQRDETDELTDDTSKGLPLSKLGQLLVKEEKITRDQLDEALQDQISLPKLGEILVEKNFISKGDLDTALKRQAETEIARKDQTIRVDVERMDEVLNLVGELVLARNRLLQLGTELELEYEGNARIQNLRDTSSHINKISSDIQLSIMKTRMQPMKRVFNRFPRMVHDIAQKLGKEISFEIQGEDTELDKSVIEEIGDPLVHLVRNAIDHGIETPEDREKAGKTREGRIMLSARCEGNQVVIEIVDDGKGLDIEKICQSSIEKGLVQPEDIEYMSDRDKLNLIFAPGLSTVSEVSDISGRGVGLDVVKSNVGKLNGFIITTSELGKGTVFSVRIPLTVAIIRALVVEVGRETFALPLEAVLETVRIPVDAIQSMDMQGVINLRDELLPILHLADLFEVEESNPESDEIGRKWLYVVVIGFAEKKVGIVVEKLLEQEEVVIKSLGKLVRPKGIAGATVLSNGKVTLIIDLGDLLEVAEEAGKRSLKAGRKKEAVQKKACAKLIMVVDDSQIARYAHRKMLEKAGYEVIEASDGVDGLEKLGKNPNVSLVLTDIFMPNMDGYELAGKIKGDERLKKIPVIALTVLEEEAGKSKGVAAGINSYFLKSNMGGVLESIKRLMNTP